MLDPGNGRERLISAAVCQVEALTVEDVTEDVESTARILATAGEFSECTVRLFSRANSARLNSRESAIRLGFDLFYSKLSCSENRTCCIPLNSLLLDPFCDQLHVR